MRARRIAAQLATLIFLEVRRVIERHECVMSRFISGHGFARSRFAFVQQCASLFRRLGLNAIQFGPRQFVKLQVVNCFDLVP